MLSDSIFKQPLHTTTLVFGLIAGVVLTISTNSLLKWIKKKQTTSRSDVHDNYTGTENIVDGVLGLIGNTPLMRIKSLSEATGCEILAKVEFLNPGGSLKDRAALNIINKAEEQGLISPNSGCTIFEGTSGSTGISIAIISRAKGYNAWIIMPDDQAEEKYQLLEKLGAKVEKVMPASIVDKQQFVNLAKSRAKQFGKQRAVQQDTVDKEFEIIDIQNSVDTSGKTGFFADQFENLSNSEAHYCGTGPEIFKQTNGKIDAFVAGAGTGGTISGISRYLKPLIPSLKGTRRRHQVDTIIEGVGLNRMTENFNSACGLIDDAIRVSDEEAVAMARFLVREEGLFVGSSSAINCVGCVRVARQLGPGNRIVTILCDSGQRSTYTGNSFQMPV
ncbi:8717_t:CDS:2 [Cetraspora pellucida]|uniref:cysteine synthase n=1 Tax=Cetraspora pellucida TaxID=1433469 RepID=A0A9N8Z703_9GLOM|nr:8717_t:CDS:2 [Cetraspora pellucida]